MRKAFHCGSFTTVSIATASDSNVIMHKWFINTLQAQGVDESLDQVGIYVPTQVSTLVYSLVFIYYETDSSSAVCVWLHYRNREWHLELNTKYLK